MGTDYKNRSKILTNVILDFFSHIRYLVEQGQALVHPLFNHTEMRHHLLSKRAESEPSGRMYCCKVACTEQEGWTR